MVKLKWKIEFKGYCYFQAVRLTQVLSALTKLKEINSLYQSIDINGSINDTCQIQDQWFKSESAGKNSEHQESVVDDPLSENDKEEQEDHLSNYRSAIDESCLQHQNGIFPAAREATLNAIVNIAPGQNQ